jgi:murein DD-endopeptidase MepM/ murein hydrolase activator NlpD
MPPGWFISVGWAQPYLAPTQIHTGIDLNLPNYGDSGKPVRAMADGIVRFADDGARIGWPRALQVAIIQHPALGIWTRTAHIAGVSLAVGQDIAAGQVFGRIGDYNRPGPPDDHCHFDMAVKNLSASPGDWPGSRPDAQLRVALDYLNPLTVFRLANS